MRSSILACLAFACGLVHSDCPDYSSYCQQRGRYASSGRYQLSWQRPDDQNCRTFKSADLEKVINDYQTVIKDPDLWRLFENTISNTLDTAIKWRGHAADNSAEELTFIITGDLNAMWLRDSANQMQSYISLLKADSGSESIASLYRGVINLQARYLLTSPYCNSFQAPAESNIGPAQNWAANQDTVKPSYDSAKVFECKFELDSLAAFLEIGANYYNRTGDIDFFGKFKWVSAIQAVMGVASAMMQPMYDPSGRVLDSAYTFTRSTTRTTETLANNGLGHPAASGTGLIRSAFRPSDDSTTFQLLIPANMMFARNLELTATIVAKLGSKAPAGLADQMSSMAASLRQAITKYGIIPVTGRDGSIEKVYAYEVDGFGSSLIMDDANIPSLLSAPFFGYLSANDTVYQATRARILDKGDAGVNGNPYFMRGPVINAVGGPHAGPGRAWPMASIVRILTSDDDAEITSTLKELLTSTDNLGLMHESINTFDQGDWTRQWFSWANGLFGQMIIDLASRKPQLLQQSFQ
ncbi:hypothetical protein GQ53DRAFT_882560 [Thozetella sp. PMI_491]|nr:hypothetical protein GQ53DRAFT_882560 [Thozetella sp. PMI_491]